MEYPALVYKAGGPHQMKGGTYSCTPVADDNELRALIAQGWCVSLDFDAVEDLPPSRGELEQKAAELGLKFDGRTSDKKLSAMISEALQ